MPDEIQLNWLDRAIGWLSPERQWNRLRHRAAITEFAATYRGGLPTRLDRGWTTTPTGVTVQTITERNRLFSMMERARKVDAENPVGHGMLNRIVDNVIGDGFTLQARTESKGFNREAEARWKAFWEAPEVTGLYTGPELERITYREYERDGIGGGWLLVDRGGQSRLQHVQGNQISTPDTKHATAKETRGQIYDGVEVNAAGRPIAFHFLVGDEYGKRKWTRIKADSFIYLPRLRRASNAIRGETCFAQVFTLLDQLDGYVDAVVIAARMAAIFGLIFKQGNPAGALGGLNTTLTNSHGNQQKAVTLENGLLKYQGRDDDVVQVQAQQPMQQTPDFIRAMLRMIGLPFDMPLELVLMDFSEPNFAAAKANLLQFYRAMTPRQNWFKARAMSRAYRWWLERELNAGNLAQATADPFAHEFLAHDWTWVDPIEQNQSALLEMDAGLSSRQRLLKKRGLDPEELTEEQEADSKDRKKRGLPIVHSSLSRDPEPTEQPNAQTRQTRKRVRPQD